MGVGDFIGKLRAAAPAACAVLAILLCCAARAPAGAEDHAPAPAKTEAVRCDRSAFRIVVDVGHTLDVPGALSARGIPEYAFNLQLAKDVRQALIDAGFSKTVLLITTTAPWAGLRERAARANRLAADLFISIHHDSVPDFLTETWEYAGEQQHFSDRFKGFAIFISNDNPRRVESLKFGSLLGKELQARGLSYTPHYTLPLMRRYRHKLLDAETGVYRYDQLIVLRDTRMPAVLLEAGSIVNREEELELASSERRAHTSAAVVAAVEQFCAARPIERRPRIVKRSAPAKAAARHGIFAGPALFAR
jgi:N-acetylmuramoyl-L-alanine amidase